MNKLESFIGDLADKAAPAPAYRPAQIFFVWLFAAVIYGGLILAFYLHPRPDLMTKFAEPLFAAEIMTLAALALSALFTAAILGFPDIYQLRRLLFLPPAIFAIFALVMGFALLSDMPPSPQPPHAMACLVCISLLSLAPALMIFYLILRLATTHPAMAGSSAALGAFAIGAIMLRLSEPTDSISHLLTWHYAPMIGVAFIGIYLGKKLFKW